MSATIPMSKLDAVNLILADLGDRPVNSLVDANRLDVTLAIQAIDASTRGILSLGWWFNEETIELTVDSAGRYNLPDDWTAIKYLSGGPTSGEHGVPNFVARGRRLYDTTNNTDIFLLAPAVTLHFARLLEFEDMPMTAREYVYAVAAVRNQTRALGSAAVDPDLRQQTANALALLRNEEVENSVEDLTYSPRFIGLMHNR